MLPKSWDLFISHASEDKEEVARPIAELLTKHGLRVWYDESSLKVGDSLRRSIDIGLAQARFGLVILSHAFFGREWPRRELDGLAARELNGQKVILPVWHGVTREDVVRFSPPLADKLAVDTSSGLQQVAARIAEAMADAEPAFSIPSQEIQNAAAQVKRRTAYQKPTDVGRPSHVAPSGVALLDSFLGYGGWPRGTASHIYGNSGAGKTSVALAAVRGSTEAGLRSVYVDADRGVDLTLMRQRGVDTKLVDIVRPETLTEALSAVLSALESQETGLVVLDTLASLPAPPYDTDDFSKPGNWENEERVIIERFCKLATAQFATGSPALLILNRFTERNVLFGTPFTIPWSTKPILDICSISIELKSDGTLKNSETSLGFFCRLTQKKFRYGVPRPALELFISHTYGLDEYRSLVEYAAENKIIQELFEVPKSWRKVHTSAFVSKELRANSRLLADLRQLVVAHYQEAMNRVAKDAGEA